MLYRFDEKRCLNGWWKIKPLYEDADACEYSVPPTDGFEEHEFLVPSFYNKPGDAVKHAGDAYYTRYPWRDKRVLDENADNLFDTFEYPVRWTAAPAAWIARTLDICKKPGKRYFIIAEAAGPIATLFVNGQKLAVHHDNTLPFPVEITDAITDGENSIAYLIEDYDMVSETKTRWPSGEIAYLVRGLWQDVYLIERDEIYIEDITIVTSVREKTFSVRFDAVNVSASPFEGYIRFCADGWNHDEKNAVSGEIALSVASGEKVTVSSELCWENPRLWDTDTPNLYMLTAQLVSSCGKTISVSHERFGFREVWIDGSDIMLNSHPVHLFSDWGHRVTLHPFTRGWVAKWLGMIRDYNMNHSRLHTAPHPEFILEMADEAGIMITNEAALHGSGNTQGAMLDEYWEHAFRHIERFVARDKNHPCLVLWSCGNEMRFLSEGMDKCRKQLPEIRALFNRLDPTRPAYHEGDSSMWNESEQDIVSRHYGKECSGMGWWDKSRPLSSGEMGLFHYAAPNNTLQLGGDTVWENMLNVVRYSTEELGLLVNDCRANGVATMGPWNFSAHINLRTNKDKRFEYEDYTTPGPKPLIARRNTCEFVYWEEGKGYTRPPMTDSIPFMFRPFAAIDLSMRTSYFANRPLVKHYTFVNDLNRDVENALARVSVIFEGGCFASTARISVKRGMRTEADFDLTHDYPAGPAKILIEVTDGDIVLDSWSRDITLDSFTEEKNLPKVFVMGDGSSEGLLNLLGCEYERIASISEAPAASIVLVERNTVRPGSTMNHDIIAFCKTGGRVILMEQTFSVFPEIRMEQKALLTAFTRDSFSPVLDRVPDIALRYWGDDPYSLLSGNSYVVKNVYKKDACERMHVIVDSGEGNFGSGDLESAAVFSLEEGDGIIYACQLLLTEKYELVSAAGRLMANLLHAAKAYRKTEERPVAVSRGGENLDALLEEVKSGGTLLVTEASEDAITKIGQAAGIPLTAYVEPEGTFNCIKAGVFPEFAGLSNSELCGVQRLDYCLDHIKNYRIAQRVMNFTEGMEPMLVTAPASCLRPFYAYKSPGLMRTYTVTRYAVEDIEEAFVVMGRVRVGEGTVYISTFENTAAPDHEKDYPKYSRLYNIVLRNLSGKRFGKNPLEGECLAQTLAAGSGKPEYLHVLRGELPDTAYMLTACGYQVERMNPKPLLDMYPFEKVACKNAPYISEDGKETVVYYTITSPIVRKLEKNVSGLPDPMAQTFLDVDVDGEIDLYLNGTLCGTAAGKCTFADLSIEGGYNHILILFRPAKKGSALSMQWRNIMHEAETSFRFE